MLETLTVNRRKRNPAGFMANRLVFFSTCVLLVLGMLFGCSESGKDAMDEKVLIRAGGSVVTVRAFHEAFESSITSPSLLFQDPEALRDKKYQVLNRLSEELIILERARELNLKISDEETARVIDDFKKDYPDDTFEKTLMENGISFLTWEKALKRRLLMEKVIRHDLSERAFSTPLTLSENLGTGDSEIPPENEPVDRETGDSENSPENEPGNLETGGSEIPPENEPVNRETGGSENSPENEPGNADGSSGAPAPDNEKPAGIPAHAIAAEAGYPDWIERLKQQYAIEIDWKLWETIVQEQVDGV